jgi:fibronectin-binding autotransporter adhesin
MNRIFRIIWSQALNTWVVVSELATRRGKRSGGEVDERVAPPALVLDRDMVEGSPPATALGSLLRRCIALALLSRLAPARGRALAMRTGLLALLGGVIAPAHAVDYYWDLNGNVAGAGGATPTGTWDSTGLMLSTSSGGTLAVLPVTTTTADRLFFSAGTDATGAYTVNVDGTQNIGRLTFQEGNTLLTGGTLNFGSVQGIIDADASQDTIAAVLTGSNGLAIRSTSAVPGSLRLTATNTYTGATFIGGTLSQATVNVFLAAVGGNALGGTTLTFGDQTNTTARGGHVTLQAAEQINDTTVVRLLGNSANNSSLTLNGFNETVGGLVSNVGGTSTVTVRNGAATDATLTLVGAGGLFGAGASTGGTFLTDGGGGGRLHLVSATTGNQTLRGAGINYTGTTTISSGTLNIVNVPNWASNITLNGGTLDLQQWATQQPGQTGYTLAAVRTHSQTIGGTGANVIM